MGMTKRKVCPVNSYNLQEVVELQYFQVLNVDKRVQTDVWMWSLSLPTNPVWWGSMHAISTYRG